MKASRKPYTLRRRSDINHDSELVHFDIIENE